MNANKENMESFITNKKMKLNTEDILHCFGPALFLERLFGIYRFRIIEGTLMPANNMSKAITFVVAIASVGVFVHFFDINKVVSQDEMLTKVDFMDYGPTIVELFQFITSAVMTACMLSRANIQIITSLANIDVTLRLNTSKEFYKQSRRHALIALCTTLVMHIIISVSDLYVENDDYGIVSIIFYYTLNYIKDLEILIFYLTMSMLNDRLIVMNKDLLKILHHKDQIFVYTIQHKNPKSEKQLDFREATAVNLRDLSLAYDMIGETCHLVNNVYNYQIFMSLVSAFVCIVITLWTSLYYYRTEVDVGNLCIVLVWCGSEVLTVGVMAVVCEMLRSTRNDTKELVNEVVMDYGRAKHERARAKAFARLIDAWPLRVCVYDMFAVDVSLMLKFISVATTYLIVIIQISHFA